MAVVAFGEDPGVEVTGAEELGEAFVGAFLRRTEAGGKAERSGESRREACRAVRMARGLSGWLLREQAACSDLPAWHAHANGRMGRRQLAATARGGRDLSQPQLVSGCRLFFCSVVRWCIDTLVHVVYYCIVDSGEPGGLAWDCHGREGGSGRFSSSESRHRTGRPQMGPAEIVASLKELCEEEGPRISTDRIVRWIDRHGGFESQQELAAYARKMKARQLARQLMYDDEETGLRRQAALELSGPGDARAVLPRHRPALARAPQEADLAIRAICRAVAVGPTGDVRLLRGTGVLRVLHDRRGRRGGFGREEGAEAGFTPAQQAVAALGTAWRVGLLQTPRICTGGIGLPLSAREVGEVDRSAAVGDRPLAQGGDWRSRRRRRRRRSRVMRRCGGLRPGGSLPGSRPP